jgi:Protein of unknown function (DUF5818)
MKPMWVSMITAWLFFATMALAQSSPSGGHPQGTTSSSPAMNGQPGAPNSGVDQSGSPGMPDNQSGSMSGNGAGPKSEKKMKGCVASQGGQYLLETKKGKAVPLSGQDISAHVGQEVTVHGTWDQSSPNSMSSSSAGGSADSGKTLNVTSVDTISDSCGGKEQK